MIQLICIDNNGRPSNSKEDMPRPKVGEEYTAIDEVKNNGREYWELQELVHPESPRKKWAYPKEMFIPKGGPDEKSYSDEVLSKIFVSIQNNKFVDSLNCLNNGKSKISFT